MFVTVLCTGWVLLATACATSALDQRTIDARGGETGGSVHSPVLAIARSAQVSGWMENRGQWPAHITFHARVGGMDVLAEPGTLGFVFSGEAPGVGVYVRLSFEGASSKARWVGESARAGVQHFYLGADPSCWHRNVRSFDLLRCEDLYPGIDVVLRLKEGSTKWDLLVDAGADLEAVRIRCHGAEVLLAEDRDGISIATPIGELVQLNGPCWQERADGLRTSLECRWRFFDEHTLGLDCPDRDPALPLVIDPELLWSTYLGTPSDVGTGDKGEAIASDGDGNVIVVGRVEGSDFPQTPGTFQRPAGGTLYNAFATKLRESDGALIWSSIFGGYGEQRAMAVAVDAQGGATVAGWTTAIEFPVTPGAYDTQAGTSFWRGFVTRFTPDASELVFSTYLEGTDTGGQVFAVAIDDADRVVVGGKVAGQDFPTTPGAIDPSYGGLGDGFVACLDPTGANLLWSTFLGGAQVDEVWALDTRADGVVAAAGYTQSTDFPTTPGAFMETKPGQWSKLVFVTLMDPTGTNLVWSTYLGGTGGVSEVDLPYGIGFDAFDTLTVAGRSQNSTDFPTTPGVLFPSPPSPNGASYVTRFEPDGSDLVYSTYFGGPNGSSLRAVSVDSSGMPTIAGIISGSGGLPTTPGAYDTSPDGAGVQDQFVARLNPRGTRLLYSTYVGGTSTDNTEGLATWGPHRATVMAWVSADGDYPTTPGAPFPNPIGGQSDVVVTSLDLLLEGVEAYGTPSASCIGPVWIGTTEMPVAGSSTFSLYATQAPPGASGWLLVSRARAELSAAEPTHSDVQVDLSELVSKIPVSTDEYGYVETPFPLPSNAAGVELFFQYQFHDPVDCPSTAKPSASAGLKIVVQ